MQYTIKAVSPETRTFSSQYGDMVSYKVKFNENPETIIEISQKASTPAPVAGQTLNGTIDMSGKFGPKFKKEYNQGGGSFTQGATSSQSTSFSKSSRFGSDPFTMYLSYAKDIAVALINSKGGYDAEQLAKILEDVAAGGKVLYDERPGAEKTVEEAPKKAEDMTDAEFAADIASAIDDNKPNQEISLDDIPF